MNSNQMAKNDMFKLVLKFFADYGGIWSGFAFLVGYVTEFGTLNGELDVLMPEVLLP